MEEQTLAEQPIRSIKELAPKPSDAIKAMLEGLRDIPSESFQVNMNSFGRIEQDGDRVICCGCAATCAVYKLAGKTPVPDSIDRDVQARYLGFHHTDLIDFENAIDMFRVGNMSGLLRYYNGRAIGIPDKFWDFQFWHLSTHNWVVYLPLIEEYVKNLEAAGF